MKFAVYGAGAVGGVLGARLITAGEEVTLIARGAHLAAIRERGLRVHSKVFGEMALQPRATDNAAEVGPVDAVLLTMKAQSVPAVVENLPPLLGPDTVVVTFQNGFPWWYFHCLDGPWKGTRVESVDPGGVIAAHLEMRRVIGGLAYCASQVREPGVIDHLESARFPLGELDGSCSERVGVLTETFQRAGVESSIRPDIRQDIWVKLLGNVPFNPISALTRGGLDGMLQFPPTRALIRSVMEEVRAVAAAVGVEIAVSSDQRITGADKMGRHKTSMLQDLEAGRSPELEPIVGAVIELADKAGVETPHMRAVYACAKLLFASMEQCRGELAF